MFYRANIILFFRIVLFFIKNMNYFPLSLIILYKDAKNILIICYFFSLSAVLCNKLSLFILQI